MANMPDSLPPRLRPDPNSQRAPDDHFSVLEMLITELIETARLARSASTTANSAKRYVNTAFKTHGPFTGARDVILDQYTGSPAADGTVGDFGIYAVFLSGRLGSSGPTTLKPVEFTRTNDGGSGGNESRYRIPIPAGTWFLNTIGPVL